MDYRTILKFLRRQLAPAGPTAMLLPTTYPEVKAIQPAGGDSLAHSLRNNSMVDYNNPCLPTRDYEGRRTEANTLRDPSAIRPLVNLV